MEEPLQSKTELLAAATIAQAILDGTTSLITGSREISALALAHAPKPLDDDFWPFVAFDDRTCEFPVGDFRRLWSADALAAKDRQAAQVEDQFREILLAACRRLVVRFAKTSEQSAPTI